MPGELTLGVGGSGNPALAATAQYAFRLQDASGSQQLFESVAGRHLSTPWPLAAGGEKLYVGGNENSSADFQLHGAVCGVVGWSRALSSSEISTDAVGTSGDQFYPFGDSRDTGCVFDYRCTSAGSSSDSTGRNSSLTLTGSASTRAGPGGVGNAILFSGTAGNYLSVASASDFHTADASWTRRAWAYFTTHSSMQWHHVAGTFSGLTTLVSGFEIFDLEWLLYYPTAAGRQRAQIDLGERRSDLALTTLKADNAGSIATGAWHHLCWRYDSSTKVLDYFQDGTLTDTLDLKGTYTGDGDSVTWEYGPAFDPATVVTYVGRPRFAYRASSGGAGDVFASGNTTRYYSFFIKMTTVSAGEDMVLFGKYDEPTASIDDLFYWSSGTQRLQYQISDGGGVNFAVIERSLADTNWHFVEAWYDGTLHMEIDRGGGASVAPGFTPAKTAVDWRIGSTPNVVPQNDFYQTRASVKKLQKFSAVPSSADRTLLQNGAFYPF